MTWPRVANLLVTQLASTGGDGTGDTEATGDYSSAVTNFKVTPAANQAFSIERMLVKIEDKGTFDVTKYGNGITLTNGITVAVKNGSGVIYSLTGYPIKTSGDWAGHCYDIGHHTFGAGNEVLVVRWTFAKHGKVVTLRGNQGEFLNISLNDDFSNLVSHLFLVEGYLAILE